MGKDNQSMDNKDDSMEMNQHESDMSSESSIEQTESVDQKTAGQKNHSFDSSDESAVTKETDHEKKSKKPEKELTKEQEENRHKYSKYKPEDFDINARYHEMDNIKMKEVHKFSSGVLLGVFAGVIFTVTFLLLLFGFLNNAGYLHLNSKGQIYVQDTQTNDDAGIGDKVESKLNTLDSLLDKFYFEDIDDDKAADNIYKAYLESFGDKYTVYYTPEEYKALEESTTGTFYGIGAVCSKQEDGTIMIAEAYEDAPAYKAGVRTGDYITAVDGTSILDMDLSAAVAMIKGELGTTVTLDITRGDQTLSIKVTRDEVKEKTVDYKMLDNNVGYLQITQFENVTTQQFKDALKDLNKQGMESLVIDIRNNPGGVLQTVVSMLDEILPKGSTIVYTEDKLGKKTEYKGKDSSELDIPVAVLVNGNSASASEIFAGAVQDYGVGKIIGTQTFGKGIVQTIKQLTDGSAIKFTIAKYFTPLGQDIHGHGVTPDIVVDLDEQQPNTDTQLNTALDYLYGQMQKVQSENSTKNK